MAKTRFAELPVPPGVQPEKTDSVWRVEYQAREAEAHDWAKNLQIQEAAKDKLRIGLLIIDAQNTFCLPEFELYVGGKSGRGAVDDNARLCRFLYRNLRHITRIVPTLDTHRVHQIFHAAFWVDAEGNHPKPGQTIISVEEVKSGRWSIDPAVARSISPAEKDALKGFALHYVETLAFGGKFPLMIWPYHAMLGGIGHALVSAVEEAVFFHAIARKSDPDFDIKGAHPLTENYSVLAPEVGIDNHGKVLLHRNQRQIDRLLEYDRLIVAGQAKSHCVAYSIDDLLKEIQKRDPRLAKKVYLLEDCSSPVVIPDVIDFTEAADKAYQRFAEAGMRLVKSTDPMDTWPGI